MGIERENTISFKNDIEIGGAGVKDAEDLKKFLDEKDELVREFKEIHDRYNETKKLSDLDLPKLEKLSGIFSTFRHTDTKGEESAKELSFQTNAILNKYYEEKKEEDEIEKFTFKLN
jgi:hypothetical protein